MKLVTKDFIIDEEEFTAYHLLQLVYGAYGSKVPKECKEHLQQALHYLIKDLEKDYPEDLDIVDNKILERITFNKDTLKDLKNNKKN